jgi:hypothetical protein
LAQLVRFLVVKLIYPDSNPRLHLRLIILSVRDNVLDDSDAFLVTDFINIKIKPSQSFRGTHSDRICMFITVSARTCINIYICTVFLKKLVAYREDPPSPI